MPIRLPVVLTPSRTELSARCHRRHFLADILDRRPREGSFKPSADFGKVLHTGAARFWLGQFYGEPTLGVVQGSMQAVIDKWHELRPWGDKHTLDMAEALMEYYIGHAKLAGNLAGEWHVYKHDGEPMVEQRQVVQVGGELLSFQIDRLLENERGELALVDLKTASRLSPYWRRQFDLWLQGKLYSFGAEQLFGRPLDYLIVEGLEKSVPVKHEYHPCPHWTASQLQEAVRLYRYLAAEDRELITRALEETVPEPAYIDPEDFDDTFRSRLEELAVTETVFNYGDCHAYNQPCEYLEICMRPPEQRMGLLQSDFIVMEVEMY